MRSNDRVSINLGPARYDSEKAIRRQIDDAQSDATTDAVDAIVNNPNLNLAGGGGTGTETPATPATGPKYTAPSLATDFPVDGLSLPSPISNQQTALGARAISGSTIYSTNRSFNAASGVSTTFPSPSGVSATSYIHYFGGYVYIEGARYSAATGWQYLNTTTLAWTGTSSSSVQIVGVSGDYIWSRNTISGNIYATSGGGTTTLQYNGNATGVVAQNGRIAFYVGGGVSGIYNAIATVPLNIGTAVSGSSLAATANYRYGLDSSGNLYYLTSFGGALMLNVRDLLGAVTQYPYVFSATGDPLDGEPTQQWDESTLSFVTGYNYLQATEGGRILVGAGTAGAYIGADNPDWPYPAIYEIDISDPMSYGSQIIHVSTEFIPDYGTGTYNGAFASAQGPVAVAGGGYTWSDVVFSSYGTSSSTTIKYDIYKAGL